MRFLFNKKSFLIFVLLFLQSPVVFAAPSVWDRCKRLFLLGTSQAVVLSDTVVQEDSSDSTKGETLKTPGTSQTAISSDTVTQKDDLDSNEDTFKILLIRHAHYSDRYSEKYPVNISEAAKITIAQSSFFESEQPLSKNGGKVFESICAASRRNLPDYSFDLLVHSPTMRTLQTAQIFLKYFPVGKVEMIRRGVDYDDILDTIKTRQVKSVVLVHHEPNLSLFVKEAVGIDFSRMNQGNMVLLEIPYPYKPGTARIIETML